MRSKAERPEVEGPISKASRSDSNFITSQFEKAYELAHDLFSVGQKPTSQILKDVIRYLFFGFCPIIFSSTKELRQSQYLVCISSQFRSNSSTIYVGFSKFSRKNNLKSILFSLGWDRNHPIMFESECFPLDQ